VSTAPAFPIDLHVTPFSSEQFLTVQFYARPHLSGFQRLAWALIEDCFLARRFALRHPRDVRGRKQRERDEAWIDGAPAPILFADLCDLLGIPADTVRRRYFALTCGNRVRHKASTFG
jgi:hypothetical protein